MDKKIYKWVPGENINVYKKDTSDIIKKYIPPPSIPKEERKDKISNIALSYFQNEKVNLSRNHEKIKHLIIEFNKRVRIVSARDLTSVIRNWLAEDE